MNNIAAFIPQTVSQKLMYSTVRIDGSEHLGTGFFFHLKLDNGENIQIILTNKHVIEGNSKLSLFLHAGTAIDRKIVATPESFPIDLSDKYLSSYWIPHPASDVDLGALLYSPIRNYVFNSLNKLTYEVFFDVTLIYSDEQLLKEVDVTDEIFMVGYPVGFRDDINNFPVFRKGIAASHPALGFGGKSQGVVDVACFSGSSGSPILVYKKPHYPLGVEKIILLGVLFGGPYLEEKREIMIEERPMMQKSLVSVTEQMLHLGRYVKAKEILTLCEAVKSHLYPMSDCHSTVPAEDQYNLLNRNAIEFERLLTTLFPPRDNGQKSTTS